LSCVTEGTNHPLNEVHVFANVLASSLDPQDLATSAHLGATIHKFDPPLAIRNPPAPLGLEPNGAVVSTVNVIHVVKLVTVSEVPIPTN
jgi:hypothetical protein